MAAASRVITWVEFNSSFELLVTNRLCHRTVTQMPVPFQSRILVFPFAGRSFIFSLFSTTQPNNRKPKCGELLLDM